MDTKITIPQLNKAYKAYIKTKKVFEKKEPDYWAYVALAKNYQHWDKEKKKLAFLGGELYSEAHRYRNIEPSKEVFDFNTLQAKIHGRRQRIAAVHEAKNHLDEMVRQALEQGMEYSTIGFALGKVNKSTIYRNYRKKPWFTQRSSKKQEAKNG